MQSWSGLKGKWHAEVQTLAGTELKRLYTHLGYHRNVGELEVAALDSELWVVEG